MPLPFTIGESIRRVELHEGYGGRRQGGISPSSTTSNVFIFEDPLKGAQHGYIYDGQKSDGYYHYTGEGQLGDQKMTQGNRAIRDHQAEGRELHLFSVRAGVATYRGQFEYFDHYLADAPESGSDAIRSVTCSGCGHSTQT